MNLPSLLLFSLGALLLVLLLLYQFSARSARRIEASLPPTGLFVEVEGVRLHLREQGQGPALLLLHGLNGQMAHFDFGMIQQLSQRYRVVALDRPGSGYSSRPDQVSADLSTQARAIAALIERLDLGKPTVVGHSLGGAVALALALEHPQRVGALALVAPLSHHDGRVRPAFWALSIRPAWLRRAFAWTLAVPLGGAAAQAVVRMVFAPERAPRDFATRGGGLLGLRPLQFLGAARDLEALAGCMPQLEARYPELAALGIPLQVLFGRDDRLLDWRSNGQALVDRVPGSRLELVDGGHMLPVTQPGRTAQFIEEAAARRTPGARTWK